MDEYTCTHTSAVFRAVVTSTRVSHSRDRGFRRSSNLFHTKLSHKVKAICKVAQKAGFRLVWIDACWSSTSRAARNSERQSTQYIYTAHSVWVARLLVL